MRSKKNVRFAPEHNLSRSTLLAAPNLPSRFAVLPAECRFERPVAFFAKTGTLFPLQPFAIFLQLSNGFSERRCFQFAFENQHGADCANEKESAEPAHHRHALLPKNE